MAEVKTLTPPPALYDYVLFYECATKDWKNIKQKSSPSGDGGLMNAINWSSTYSYDPRDAGGKTLFGVTENVWKNYVATHPNKGYKSDLNTMGQRGWLDVMGYYWGEYGHADKCVNYPCAFLLFQMAWGGFGGASNLLTKLKNNADKKDYKFITTKTSIFKKIADATHAYSDPMNAFTCMRSALLSYYYNISTPDRTNKVYRVGWLNRAALPFTLYGLYIPTNFGGGNVGLKYESTLQQWDTTVSEMVSQNKSGYVKIFDWGLDPESVANLTSNPYSYEDATNPYYFNPSSGSSSGAYGGCGNVAQLGSFTNSPSTQSNRDPNQQTRNRENVLNTLVNGSYTPNGVKKCSELITSDKKKSIKV